MDRGHARLNLVLIAVAASLGVLIGIVGAAHRRPAPRPVSVAPESRSASFSTRTPLAALALEPAEAPAAVPAPEPASTKTARVSGTVTLLDGSPAAAARVLLGDAETRTDAGGRFVLDFAADETRPELVAWLAGHELALLPAFGRELAPGTEHEARLVLGRPTASLSGVARADDGTPLAHWSVALDGPDPLDELGLREPAFTDAAGAFTLAEVPPGVHVVRVWKERRELGYLSEPLEAGTTGAVVLVPSGAR